MHRQKTTSLTSLAATLAALVGTVLPVFASNDYTGANNGDWFVETNWSLGHVPTAADTPTPSSSSTARSTVR